MVLLLAALSFLIGSIPVGAVIAGIRGIDLKSVGSGNIGATNVLRAVGKLPALLTLLGDMAKGAIPVLVARHFGGDILLQGIVGLAAIFGHNFSIFLSFKGGKGVATSLGALLVYSPVAGLITVGLWLVTAAATRYSSLGAIVSFTLLPVTIYLFDYFFEKMVICVIIAVLLMIRHTGNIKRLINGTESKIGVKA